ncbi:MAG: hypothetical protein K9M19_01140 [Candidatus Marinimicrobia bacterium]|nr:hypothetical protein [Candidatus Neomarinimicrobiota bacterium]
MKSRHTLIIIVLLIPLLGFSKTPNWEIVTLNHQLYRDVVFQQLVGDTLVLNAYGKTCQLPVDSIETIRDANGPRNHPVVGFVFGAVSGRVIGNILYDNTRENTNNDGIDRLINVSVSVVTGGFLGVVVGAFITTDNSYDFKKLDHAEKVEIINALMTSHKRLKPFFDSSE